MKPPQRTEAERIAGTLTKAQREAVAKGFWNIRPLSEDFIEVGLLQRCGDRHWMVELTEIGLAVRALLSQDQTDER